MLDAALDEGLTDRVHRVEALDDVRAERDHGPTLEPLLPCALDRDREGLQTFKRA